jgi:hypothetical protein
MPHQGTISDEHLGVDNLLRGIHELERKRAFAKWARSLNLQTIEQVEKYLDKGIARLESDLQDIGIEYREKA